MLATNVNLSQCDSNRQQSHQDPRVNEQLYKTTYFEHWPVYQLQVRCMALLWGAMVCQSGCVIQNELTVLNLRLLPPLRNS